MENANILRKIVFISHTKVCFIKNRGKEEGHFRQASIARINVFYRRCNALFALGTKPAAGWGLPAASVPFALSGWHRPPAPSFPGAGPGPRAGRRARRSRRRYLKAGARRRPGRQSRAATLDSAMVSARHPAMAGPPPVAPDMAAPWPGGPQNGEPLAAAGRGRDEWRGPGGEREAGGAGPGTERSRGRSGVRGCRGAAPPLALGSGREAAPTRCSPVPCSSQVHFALL